MTTIIINDKIKEGKALLDYVKNLSYVKVSTMEKSPYSATFKKKIKQAEKEIKEGNTKIVDTNDLWESLGLK